MEGSVIGNYRVVRKLTEGGMGTVYEAVHDRLGKRAALKTLHPEFARRPEFVQRLTSEPAFIGKSFSHLKLEQDDAPSAIEFSITTEGAQKQRREDGRG